MRNTRPYKRHLSAYETWANVVEDLIFVLRQHGPNFDEDKFRNAVYE